MNKINEELKETIEKDTNNLKEEKNINWKELFLRTFLANH